MKNQKRNAWKTIFRKYFPKHENSKLAKYELLAYPEDTLGFHLGSFLICFDFESEPAANHDAIHVLTKTGISVTEEIGMQCYLLGNGKRDIPLFASIVLGVVIFPLHCNYFVSQYRKGKRAHLFYSIDFSKILGVPVTELRQTFNII